MNLLGLQDNFQSYLLAKHDQMLQHVTAIDEAFAKQRLDIYRDAYFLRLHEVLTLDYPKLRCFIGEAAFTEMARSYLQHYPSHTFSVRYFGQSLAEFLQQYEPYRQQPILNELAQFEWALSEIIDVANGSVLTLPELAAWPQEQWPAMRIQPHPSVRVLQLQWNAPDVWQALQQQQTAVTPVKNETAQSWLIWRKELQSYYCRLENVDAVLMQGLLQGKDFSAVCADLTTLMPEEQVANHTVQVLLRWLPDGLLSQIS